MQHGHNNTNYRNQTHSSNPSNSLPCITGDKSLSPLPFFPHSAQSNITLLISPPNCGLNTLLVNFATNTIIEQINFSELSHRMNNSDVMNQMSDERQQANNRLTRTNEAREDCTASSLFIQSSELEYPTNNNPPTQQGTHSIRPVVFFTHSHAFDDDRPNLPTDDKSVLKHLHIYYCDNLTHLCDKLLNLNQYEIQPSAVLMDVSFFSYRREISTFTNQSSQQKNSSFWRLEAETNQFVFVLGLIKQQIQYW